MHWIINYFDSIFNIILLLFFLNYPASFAQEFIIKRFDLTNSYFHETGTPNCLALNVSEKWNLLENILDLDYWMAASSCLL